MRVGKDGETGILINCSWGCEMVHAGMWNGTAALKNNLTVSQNAIHTSVCDILSHSNIMKAYAPCLVAKLCPTLCDPMDCSLTVSCPWGFSRQEYWSGLPCLPPGDLHNPGIELRSPSLQADSLLSELPGKPMNTGVGSLSLLLEIFLTQETNLSLLHCRQILYQGSYQGSPMKVYFSTKTCT